VKKLFLTLAFWAMIFSFALVTVSDAQIQGGTRIHNHSNSATGGSTIAPSVFSNAVTFSNTATFNSTLTTAGNVNLLGSITSNKACAANYTRIGPNFCLWIGALGGTAITTACTSIAAPAGAIALLVEVRTSVFSTNVLGALDSVAINWFNDATCTTAIGTATWSEREFVALASQIVADGNGSFVFPVVAGSIRVIATVLSGASTANLDIKGYFD
jgi:hypothetical protein